LLFQNHRALEATFYTLALPKSGTAMRTLLIPGGQTMTFDNFIGPRLITMMEQIITITPISWMPHITFVACTGYWHLHNISAETIT
jgi:hypothetical protein